MSSSATLRPNVIVIVPDDHQYDALGCAGHPEVVTPVLDTLARRGARFTRAGVMGSLMPAVCSPSRASLLTGGDVTQANLEPRLESTSVDYVTIPPVLSTLPEIFRGAGYHTFITGKWHNDVAALQRSFRSGEKIFVGGMCGHREVPVRSLRGVLAGEKPRIGTGFSTELFCGAAEGFISSQGKEAPFFCYVALTSPHDPRTPPPEFRARYEPSRLRLPPAFRSGPAFDNGDLHVRDETLAAKPLAPDVLREHLADYYGMITHQDAEIGRVLAAVRAQGIEDNTYIVYIGDHGLALGRHGLLGKQNLYEHSLRVPFIITGPGIEPGTAPTGLVYAFDIFATLLECAGLPAPANRASRSLVPLLREPHAAGRAELFALYRDCQRMIRQDRWKLVHYHVGGRHFTELFDLMTDPHEENDLSANAGCADIAADLSVRLGAWCDAIGDRWMPRLLARPAPAVDAVPHE